ncbi:hypothetical protein TNCT_608901 [Trichonephila clavata]|uniref:Reverse transcriptase/retrotransposon-derived protein RNase H-like domain-containing protein n=1 Tax=Trichonephila clavata TaxID=2740835 RepID=A0A8X6H7U2_TRICU|nr:hypothetical protein TNCT_608901 [Trichonephila clavata]
MQVLPKIREKFLNNRQTTLQAERRKQKLIWMNECNNDFSKLKDELTPAPLLAYPETEKQFILDSDASHESISCVVPRNRLPGACH